MRTMRCERWRRVRLVSAFLAAVCVMGAQEPALLVRVYNPADAPAWVLRAAIEEATVLFQRSGVDVRWVHCEPVPERAAGDPCRESADPRAFSIGVTREVPAGVARGALAFSLLNAANRNHGAVFYGRVSDVARRYDPVVSCHQVLGHAMVHEIVHLALGGSDHDDSGLMRGEWRPADFRAMGQRGLRIAEPRLRLLKSELVARGGGAAAIGDIVGRAWLPMTISRSR